MDNDVPETAIRSVRYQNEGFVALTAFRCEEALEICKHLPVALAVLDVDMGGANGLQLARKIRDLNRSIAIVMYSGEQEIEWQGVPDAFLEKGSDPSQLLDISRKLVLQTYTTSALGAALSR